MGAETVLGQVAKGEGEGEGEVGRSRTVYWYGCYL